MGQSHKPRHKSAVACGNQNSCPKSSYFVAVLVVGLFCIAIEAYKCEPSEIETERLIKKQKMASKTKSEFLQAAADLRCGSGNCLISYGNAEQKYTPTFQFFNTW